MNKRVRVLIIGAGFGGLCMAAKLKSGGETDFLIVEKSQGVGGTWRNNTYPGAECDVPSALYSYSFARNPTWDFKWAKQPQILEYIEKFADDYGLRAHLQFGAELRQAEYERGGWTVTLSTGEVLNCQFLISAIGQLHHPNIPTIKTLDVFENPVFHSAVWDHSVDLSGKDIAVIGNAASAIQLIPEIAAQTKRLTIYHRTANWIIPKGDRPYSKLEKWLGKVFPPFTNLYRFHIWCLGEFGLYPMIKGNPIASWAGRILFRRHLHRDVKDKNLRRTLTPDYPIGAKRILLSDKYFPSLIRENVELVSAGIQGFTKSGIISNDGKDRHHDVVVFATGFQTNPFLKSIKLIGKSGQVLADKWKDGAYAYHGTMTWGFPNLFILYGPNTNTGHTSIIFKLEQQVGYILKLIAQTGQGEIDVKRQAEETYNSEIQRRLSKLAWAKIDESWYKHGDRITNNWPGSSLEFKRRLKTPIWDDFDIKS